MLALAALNISLVGVIYFLIAVAVVAFLIVGLKWLAAQMGWAIPPPMLAILGFICFLLLLLYALGVFGGGSGVTIR
jgi:hypothetical protein